MQVTKLTEERIQELDAVFEKSWSMAPEVKADTLAALRELLLLRKREEWIKVEDRMPKINERVLVSYRGDTWTARLESPGNKKTPATWILPTGITNAGITHWRPLPDAPTKD